MRTLICDDDNKILEKIYNKVKDCFDANGVNTEYLCYNDPRKLMSYIQNGSADIVFLDIDMPYFTGMDIAGLLNEKDMDCILVFVTSHDALVYQTFTYRPFGFIRKTHIDEELNELVIRIRNELTRKKQEITVQRGQELTRILVKDILYIESDGNYLNIFTTHGEVRIRETMTNIEKELCNKNFIRCHKGYFVNMDYITKVRVSELELKNSNEPSLIPIGRSFEKDVRRKILDSIRG